MDEITFEITLSAAHRRTLESLAIEHGVSVDQLIAWMISAARRGAAVA